MIALNVLTGNSKYALDCIFVELFEHTVHGNFKDMREEHTSRETKGTAKSLNI